MIVKSRTIENSSGSQQLRPWWNRPLIGDKSLLDRLKAVFLRQPVIDEVVDLHASVFQDLSLLADRLKSLDLSKFGNPEFLAYVRMSRAFQKGEGNYAQLQPSMALLQAGLTAHQSFTNLEQIEFTHRGRKFNDFYTFVDDLCEQRVQPTTFCRQVKAKSAEIYGQMKSSEGKEALRRYTLHLERIGRQDMSLNLLYAFKRLQFRSYNIFRVVSDILKDLRRSDLLNLELLTALVIREFDSFAKLGDLIGLKPEQQNVTVYSLLFQYLAMTERHARSYDQFQGLITQLIFWQELYQKLCKIRHQYPVSDYKVPKQFLVKVPGWEIYDKYAQYFEV